MALPSTAPSDGPLVLYDGTCALCSRSVRFILRHERDHAIVFAPLQGPTAAAMRVKYPQIPVDLDSVVYIANGRAYLRSKAFLYASRHMTAPWRWGYAFRWLPAFVLDLGYRLIAALRYRIWGRVELCDLPDPEQRARFVD